MAAGKVLGWTRGQVLILVTLAFVVLGVLIGLAIDGGRAYLLRARLSKWADAAAMAAAAKLLDSFDAAHDSACDAAIMNGLSCDHLTIQQVTVTNPDGSTQPGVQVIATASMNTSFMRLGTLIGCGTPCEQVNVSAFAIGTIGGFFDLALNMDDTHSMHGKNIKKAKEGATILVDTIIPAGGSSNSNRVAMVPFRGCYNDDGSDDCIDQGNSPGDGDIVPLTDSNLDLANGINALEAEGGSGTNVCEGLFMTRQRLFESGKARPDAKKFLVLLTDADSNPKEGLSVSPDCNAAKENALDLQTFKLATNIKEGNDVGSSGQTAGQEVEIFVIYYGKGSKEDSKDKTSSSCDSSKIGNKDDDRNLALCIASSSADFFPAPSAEDIRDAFVKIIGRLPVRLAA